MKTFNYLNFTISAIAFIILGFSEVNAQEINEKSTNSTIKVLFIGSSHFGYNNMPGKVKALANASQKDISIHECITYGWVLSQHADDDDTHAKINSANWDYVFLQGSNLYLAKSEWHSLIKPYVNELKKAILANSSSTKIFYMLPWAYENGLSGFEGYTDTWEEMSEDLYHESKKFAKAIDISLAPAGWAFYKARKKDPDISLYMADQGHPNNTGSYLLACVIYSSIFLESCEGNSYQDDLDGSTASFLQKIGSKTVLDNLSAWNISVESSFDDDPFANSEIKQTYCYPNPCSENTSIQISLKQASRVTISVYDTHGQLIETYFSNLLPTGEHKYPINTENLSNGLYICSIKTNQSHQSLKLIKQ